jgi:hypothetical protein
MHVGQRPRQHAAKANADEARLAPGRLGAAAQDALGRGHRARRRTEIDAGAPTLDGIAERGEPLAKAARHEIGAEKRRQHDDRVTVAAGQRTDPDTRPAQTRVQNRAPFFY